MAHEITKPMQAVLQGLITEHEAEVIDGIRNNDFIVVPSGFMAICSRLVHIIDFDYGRQELTTPILKTGHRSSMPLVQALVNFISEVDKARGMNEGVLPVAEPKSRDISELFKDLQYGNDLTRNFTAIALALEDSIANVGMERIVNALRQSPSIGSSKGAELNSQLGHFSIICQELRKALGDNVPAYKSESESFATSLNFQNGSRIEMSGSGETPKGSDQSYDELMEQVKAMPSGSAVVYPDFTATYPSHYNATAISTFDIIDDWGLGFYAGNAVKYIQRAGKKDPETEIEDLEKAAVYIQNEIRIRQLTRLAEACPQCGQFNTNQTGEYLCSACQAPTVHDNK